MERKLCTPAFKETDFLSTFRRNPQHATFWFARYKHVSRILAGEKRVIEVGCGNGFAGAMVAQTVGLLVQTDIKEWNPVDGKYKKGQFTAAYALDVLEHVHARDEDAFLDGIAESLTQYGTCIIGMPSLESQPHASQLSRSEHINCKTEGALRELMQRHFVKVYLFTMQDEALGTSFGPMAHYRLALANTPR